MVVKIAVAAIISVILINTTKQIKPEYSLPLTIACSIIMISIIVKEFSMISISITEIANSYNVDIELINTVIKIGMISILKSFICNICNDYSYLSISDKIDLAARVTMISICIPYVQKILVDINNLL